MEVRGAHEIEPGGRRHGLTAVSCLLKREWGLRSVSYSYKRDPRPKARLQKSPSGHHARSFYSNTSIRSRHAMTIKVEHAITPTERFFDQIPDFDPECRALCVAMSLLPGIRTLEAAAATGRGNTTWSSTQPRLKLFRHWCVTWTTHPQTRDGTS